jgi:hypothetical protein
MAETMRERIKDAYTLSGGRLEPVMDQIMIELERIEARQPPPPMKNSGGSDGLIQAAQICEDIANEPGPDIDDWDLARKATAADLAIKFRNLAGNAFSEDD